MSRPQNVHTHLPGSAATAGVEDEDEESDDGEKQSSSKMSSEPEEPCHEYQSDEAFHKAIQLYRLLCNVSEHVLSENLKLKTKVWLCNKV